jgi:hypothetical protein
MLTITCLMPLWKARGGVEYGLIYQKLSKRQLLAMTWWNRPQFSTLMA